LIAVQLPGILLIPIPNLPQHVAQGWNVVLMFDRFKGAPHVALKWGIAVNVINLAMVRIFVPEMLPMSAVEAWYR
jgi:hypothetical protein